MTHVDVLAFGAHPDDIELAVGGTLLVLKQLGYRTGAVDATRGELGTRGTADVRAEECKAASKLLQLDTRRNLGLPDGSVMDDATSRASVIQVIRELQPTVVIAPRSDDLHPDHARLARLVKEATFFAGVAKHTPTLPPHRPRAIWQYPSHSQFTPSFIVDITATFEQKRQAALAYRSQFHDAASTEPATYISRKEFWSWWEGRARHYGNLIGVEFGEPFLVDAPLKLDDPMKPFIDFGYYPK